MSSSTALFACSRCFARFPYDDLSAGQQLCKECRGSFPVVKCTYCRSEFQQTSKGNTSTICKKCEQNVKSYGKPSACEYCNIIAAFIGNKCQRCTNSEIKYGPPVNCEQCKQKCAYDRQDDDKKVDGKLLCWLCTLSFKRALAKTKQGDAERRANMKIASMHKKHKEAKMRSHNKRPNRPDVTKMPIPDEQPPNKVARNNAAPGMVRGDVDPHSSDHMVAMTQLKEQISSLKKQVGQKDAQILVKDKMITELKAKNFTTEFELRNKMKNSQKEHEDKMVSLNSRISTLLKQVATLSKGSGRKSFLKEKSAQIAAAAILNKEEEKVSIANNSAITNQQEEKVSIADNSAITNQEEEKVSIANNSAITNQEAEKVSIANNSAITNQEEEEEKVSTANNSAINSAVNSDTNNSSGTDSPSLQ